jgi:hypothetical protein
MRFMYVITLSRVDHGTVRFETRLARQVANVVHMLAFALSDSYTADQVSSQTKAHIHKPNCVAWSYQPSLKQWTIKVHREVRI